MKNPVVSDSKKQVRVLFVCLGNICRSPLAEGVLLHLAEQAGCGERLMVRSAGTNDYHVGEGADPGSVRVAQENGVDLTRHRARQFVAQDFSRFDYILGMDRNNLRRIVAVAPEQTPVVTGLLLDFDSATTEVDVPDPWGGGPHVFRDVYQIVHRGCVGFLKHLRETGSF